MTRGRRAALLIGLATIMGSLAASDIADRERRIRESLEPLVDVVVARDEIRAGSTITVRQLATRRVPSRFAPAIGVTDPRTLAGATAAVDVPAGSDVTRAQIAAPTPASSLRVGERIVQIVASGSQQEILPSARVDVLVTRDGRGTTLALENVEVMSIRRASAGEDGTGRVVAGLRVTVRQALFLTAAQSFAREIRLLPRAAGDARTGDQGESIDEGLSAR